MGCDEFATPAQSGRLQDPVRVATFTGGRDVPSARFRVRQYIASLDREQVEVTDYPSKAGNYPPLAKWARPFWLAATVGERIGHAVNSRGFDAVLFQRELISTLLTVEPWFHHPLILDVDDAIWLHRRGSFAHRLAKLCDAIICGNSYLAEHFSRYTSNVYLLPTAVDTEWFRPDVVDPDRVPIIGWSGTSANFPSLAAIEPALSQVLRHHPSAKMRVISNAPPPFREIPADRVEYIPWTPKIEVSALQDLAVGIMPLQDNEWSRGKCAAKMLTYLACAVPAVVSPVGVNAEILGMANVGLAAKSIRGWTESISSLLSDRRAAAEMGHYGQLLVQERFSVQALAPRFARIIRGVACDSR